MKFSHACATALLISVPVVVCAQDAKREFEINFFADNFAATVLPNAPQIKAGDLLSTHTLELEDSLEACMPSEWEARYDRSPPGFSLTTGMKSQSGTIDTRVATSFGLTVRGSVAAEVRATIAETGFQIEADTVRLERRRIESIINVDDPLCQVFIDGFIAGYVPWNNVLVGNAYFVDGDIQYEFNLSLSGDAEGEVTSDRLVAFLNSVPFLSRIASYFDANVGLSVGAGRITSETVTARYGPTGQRAIAFRPHSVNTQEARIFFDDLIEASGGISELAAIAADLERASVFLEEFPQFSLAADRTFLGSIYSSEGLVPYQGFLNEQPQFATEFAQAVSWVLTINAVVASN